MVSTSSSYQQEAIEAARSVLLELAHLLGQYREAIVLIGGWVPELLFPNRGHIGSMDIDLALDHGALQEAGYATIRQLLLGRGYVEGKQPCIFYRQVAAASN
jgi:hypothetical protein